MRRRWRYASGFGSFIITFILFLTILLPLFQKQEPFSAATTNGTHLFGWTTTYASDGTTIENSIKGINATPTNGNGKADWVKAALKYVTTNGAWKIKCGLYYASNNTYIATTEEKIFSNTLTSSYVWYQFNFSAPKPYISNNTVYRLYAWSNSSPGSINIDYRSSWTTGRIYKGVTYGAWPAPLTGQTFDAGGIAIYCVYNVESKQTLISPENGSDGVSLKPLCSIWANDSDGNTLTVTWQTNRTGSWVTSQVNSSVTANTTVKWNYSLASAGSTKYWYRVYVADNDNNISRWYCFTTEENVTARSWKQLLSGWFRFSNMTAWKQRQTGWFLFRNLTIWKQKLSGYFRFSNQTMFKQEQSGWFNFRNLTGWKQSQSGWFRFGNLTNWKQTQSGWFRFGNQTGFKQILSGFFRFSNQTGFKQETAGWFRFSNNTVFKQEVSGWFRFSNLSLDTWKQVEQGWFRFSNNTGFKKETSGWFRFSNSTGYKQKVSGWFRFSNLSVGIVILSVYPANHSTNVLRNVTYHITVADSTGHSMNITWKRDNGTVYLGSSINVYNGTYFMFSNASLSNHVYNWSVNITDGTSWLNQSQWYRTGMSMGGAGLVVTGGNERMNSFLLIGLFGGMMFSLVLWRRKKRTKEK